MNELLKDDKMKVLMTGVTGYIGRKLLHRLWCEGFEIGVVVRSGSNTEIIKDKCYKIIDSNDNEEVYNQIHREKWDLLIHIAGSYFSTHTSHTIQKLLNDNVVFGSIVLDAFIKSGGDKIINTSSIQQRYLNRDYSPINFYAATKQAYEDVIRLYTEQQKVNAITLELFDTYGDDDNRNKVFNYVRRLKNGEQIDMTQGRQKMYFVYIDDVIEAYCKAIEILDGDVANKRYVKYSVRGEEPVELKEFVCKYIELSGLEATINWGKRAYMEKEIMDPTGYGKTLPGWSIQCDYIEGIRRCAIYDKMRR